jgi:predicted dehydrogenase
MDIIKATAHLAPVAPLTVGVIGCGAIVRNVHLPVLLSLPEVEVAWLTDQDASKARGLSAASGVAALKLPDDLAELPNTDVLLLAIPNGARPPYLDLIRKGIAQCAYVEKPFARSRKEHEFLVRGLEDWQVAVGLDRRSFGLTRLAMQVINEKLFGPLNEVRFEFGGLGRILTAGGYLGDPRLAGGGIMYQMGVHYIDSILFITKAEDVCIQTGVMEVEDGLDIHTEADLMLTFGDKRQIPFHVLTTTLKRTNNRIALMFDRARVRFTPAYGDPQLEVLGHAGEIIGYLRPTASHGPLSTHASYAAHWQRALESFTKRAANETSASACRLTTKALETLYGLQHGVT